MSREETILHTLTRLTACRTISTSLWKRFSTLTRLTACARSPPPVFARSRAQASRATEQGKGIDHVGRHS